MIHVVESLLDWKNAMTLLYQQIISAINLIKKLETIKDIIIKREYTITEIKNDLKSGELHFGDEIKVIGTFSEYIPFLDIKHYLTREENIFKNISHTARIEPINNMYCGALFPLDQKDSFSEKVMPIFYGLESRMIEHYTGEMLEINCRIKQIPLEFSKVLNSNEYFTFEKEEDLTIPFGLEVKSVEPYGIVDSFQINTWILGNLNPYPTFHLELKKTCLNCKESFAFMQIDPIDWPLKYGCRSATESEHPEIIEKNTEEFLKMEKNTFPYILFPHKFDLFEILCPKVDVFNNEQLINSHKIIKKGIQENIEHLFSTGPWPENLIKPDEANMTIDYQYDQRKKITEQHYDYSKIPDWMCPSYQLDPNFFEKLSRKGIDVEDYIKEKEEKRFKITMK